MNKQRKSTYTLEIRIGSMLNDPVEQIESPTVFQSFSIGDKFNHNTFDTQAWEDLPKNEEVYYIIDKSHIIAEIGNSMNHMIIICLKSAAMDRSKVM